MKLLLLISFTTSSLVAAYSNEKMACLVNSERANRGLQALGIDSRLTQAAQAHSSDQARRRQMTHTGSDGSDPGKRVTRAGFNWNSVAENVAYGYKDETTCMKQWMNSPGHKANILGKYQMFGSAAVDGGGQLYYTQDFGTDKQGTRNVPKCNGSNYGGNSDSSYGNSNNSDYGNNGGDYGSDGGYDSDYGSDNNSYSPSTSYGGGKKNGGSYDTKPAGSYGGKSNGSYGTKKGGSYGTQKSGNYGGSQNYDSNGNNRKGKTVVHYWSYGNSGDLKSKMNRVFGGWNHPQKNKRQKTYYY